MTGYSLDSKEGAWQQQVNLLFPGTYSHTWVFLSARVVLSVTLIPGFVVIMDSRLMDDGRLFSSLYFHP